MTAVTDSVLLTKSIEGICALFTKTIGTKNEAFIWGIYSTDDYINHVPSCLDTFKSHKKIADVKAVMEPLNPGQIELFEKGLTNKSIVYFHKADEWDQDLLLKAQAAIGKKGCKGLLGFSKPTGLSMGVYTFLVTYELTPELETKPWAINMSIPIGSLQDVYK